MVDPWPEYKVVRTLGKGASAVVEEVQVLGVHSKNLALKTIIWEGKHNAEILRGRAVREMAIMKKLRHPCLPKLVMFRTTPGSAQILMTQGEMGDLQQMQEDQHAVGLTESQVKLFAAEILLALECLHENGVVHADLKPENVIVRTCGHVMLCDFDMSLMKSDIKDIEQDNSGNCVRCVGTLEFCAPEILSNGMHSYSEVSDFWGFGVLIYELVCGCNPFGGISTEQTTSRILSQTPRIPDDVICSKELRSFVSKLLRHDPQSRLGWEGIASVKNHPWFDDFDWERHLRELMRCDLGD